ncbi:hypothetical protein F2P81_021613 [Scophthalmus maximus]|uniref:Uncharacterized protein n=1 Tax=Scophthalmus maximus TaxID=52904 RepID=A0A6A4RVV0_SCOMX|nr:hypothetical protein F2P81_021613 [Scophthalmus maximus]
MDVLTAPVNTSIFTQPRMRPRRPDPSSEQGILHIYPLAASHDSRPEVKHSIRHDTRKETESVKDASLSCTRT